MRERIINRLGRFIKRGQEQAQSPYDPKTSAEDFARFVQASTPYHLEFGNARMFSLNLDPNPKIPEYQERLKERAEEILKRARITPQFRAYIISDLLMQYQLGMGPSQEYNMKELTDIDLEKGEYGIFDTKQAMRIEKSILGKMLTHEDELSMMFATGISGINLEEWSKTFRALNKQKPV